MNLHNLSGGDSLAERLLRIAQYIGVVIFGLLPLIFVPTVGAATGYTKILVAFVGAFFALIVFVFSVLRRGSFNFQNAYPLLALWAFAGVSIASSLLSGDFRDSFWGTEIGPQTAVFSCFVAFVATLWMFLGNSKRTLMHLYVLLMGSGVVIALYMLIRLLLGADTLGFGLFNGSLTLTPFGEWNSLAIFFGLLSILSLTALEQLPLQRAGKVLFVSVTAASLFMLALINFIGVFIVLGLVSLIVTIYSLTRGRFSLSQTLARSQVSMAATVTALITLLISGIFVVGGSAVGSFISDKTGISYIEVRPSMQATSDIARQVYSHDPVLGAGPNRFADVWRMYRDPSINSTIFWGTEFQYGYGHVPTIFVTHGVLGGLIWIVFLASFIYVGLRALFRTEESDRLWYFIALSSFIASVYLWGMAFLYVPNATLLILGATTTGIFFAARHALIPSTVKTYQVMRNPRMAFATISVVVVVIVLSVGVLYTVGRHYTANYLFRSAFFGIQQGEGEDVVLGRLVRAFEYSKDDLFAAQLSRYQSDKMIALLNAGDPGAQAAFQSALENAIQAGRTATELDGNDPENWATLGRAYAAVVPLNIANAYELSLEALKKAQELDPRNPLRFLALAELEALHQNAGEARANVMRAIELKPNYTEAIYMLAQIDIAEGKVGDAINATAAVAQLDPQNPVRFFQLGILEIADKRYENAAASLERAIALNNEYSNARYYLALTYDALGKSNEARVQLEEVLKLNPGNQDVLGLLERLSRGQKLTEAENSSAPQGGEPVAENSETTPGNEPVTSGTAPETPLLSPVNNDTAVPENPEAGA